MESKNIDETYCEEVVVNSHNKKREIVIRYVGIAIISFIFTFFDLAYIKGNSSFLAAYILSFVRTTLIWTGSMYIINYSITKFSMFRETAKLILFQVGFLTVFVVLVELAEIFVIERFFKISLTMNEKSSLLIIALIITFMISAIYASAAFFIQWKQNLLRSQALEKANLEARYDTLRNQVNPHFLFNSLNTLLMLVQDNPVASRYVESISEIMRYMLQSRDKDAVLLRDELKIARDYVFIQQSRFGDKLNVAFDVPESFYHYAIPPLAIQMLLENAVKHNVVSKEDPLFVKVFVTENLFLVVENTVKDKIDKDASTGVGLENIQNRYLHLTGKNIVVRRDSGKFTVMLPLFEKPI
jgi:LytS/YehU family sensor histidine kinase